MLIHVYTVMVRVYLVVVSDIVTVSVCTSLIVGDMALIIMSLVILVFIFNVFGISVVSIVTIFSTFGHISSICSKYHITVSV